MYKFFVTISLVFVLSSCVANQSYDAGESSGSGGDPIAAKQQIDITTDANVCMYSAAGVTTRNAYNNDCSNAGGKVGRGETWRQKWLYTPYTCYNADQHNRFGRADTNVVDPGSGPGQSNTLSPGELRYIYVSGKSTVRADYYNATDRSSWGFASFERCLQGLGPAACAEGEACPAE